MTPEGKIKRKVNVVLKALGADCWRFMPVQTGYGSPALDYLLCYRGRFIAIETKKKGGKLTPLQQSTKAAMEAAGALVLVVEDDNSLYVALRYILFESKLHDINSQRAFAAPDWDRDILEEEDQGTSAEYVRQFIKNKKAA